MSEMYMFEWLDVKERTAKVRIEVVHPDCGNYTPDVPNFMLQLLIEFYWIEKMGYIYNAYGMKAVLSKEEYAQRAKDSPCREQLEQWLGYKHGANVSISKEEYDEIRANYDAYCQKHNIQVTSYGFDSDIGYHYTTPAHEDAIVELANVFITDIKIVQEAENEQDESPYWWGEVEFSVSTFDLLAHLVVGSKWGSAMYEYHE